MKRTRIIFDFDGAWRESIDRLEQIICSSHWASGINFVSNDDHKLLLGFVKNGVIVIDECEYESQESPADYSENSRLFKDLLGKRDTHHILWDMTALFADQQFERANYYRNTIYLPNQKAYMRADGMKPEDIAEMLASDECDKIILFPYFPLGEHPAYYELSLGIKKSEFTHLMSKIKERQTNKMFEVIKQANKRSMAGYRATLRVEKKSDWKTVEQITYRAFRDAPPTGADDDGMEALLARKLRSRAAFVPELDYVAELNGLIIGNIMYTRSKVVGDNENEWDTLTFGPVSVLPKYQRQGVGSALIRKTLEAARELGYRGVLIFGHESYYPRFGFKPASEFGIVTAEGKNFPAFMAMPLYDGAFDGVRGRLICDEVYYTLDKEESDKLNAMLAEPMDIDEYIDAQPYGVQPILRKVRGVIRSAIPGAVEKISYQMPTFWIERNLIHFAAQRNHLGLYPGAAAMEYFKPRLTAYKTSKGAVQFPYKTFGEKQLSLISEIAVWCGQENAR